MASHMLVHRCSSQVADVYEHKQVPSISPGLTSPEQAPFFNQRRKKGGVFTSLGEKTMAASPAHLLHIRSISAGGPATASLIRVLWVFVYL